MRSQSETDPLAGRPILRKLSENWWLFLIRGIAAISPSASESFGLKQRTAMNAMNSMP